MIDESPDGEGITRQEFEQSTRNFINLVRALELQTTMARPDILESGMNAIILLMIADLGHTHASKLLHEIADRVLEGGPAILN